MCMPETPGTASELCTVPLSTGPPGHLTQRSGFLPRQRHLMSVHKLMDKAEAPPRVIRPSILPLRTHDAHPGVMIPLI